LCAAGWAAGQKALAGGREDGVAVETVWRGAFLVRQDGLSGAAERAIVERGAWWIEDGTAGLARAAGAVAFGSEWRERGGAGGAIFDF